MEGSPINTHLTQQNRSLCPAQHRSHGDEARTMPLITWNDPRFPLGYNILPDSKICEETNRNEWNSCYTRPQNLRSCSASEDASLVCMQISSPQNTTPGSQGLLYRGEAWLCCPWPLLGFNSLSRVHLPQKNTAASDLCPPQKAPRGQWEASVQHSPLAMKAFKRDAEQWAGLELKGWGAKVAQAEGREGGREAVEVRVRETQL